MSARLRRLLPLGELPATASPPILNASWCPAASADDAGRPVAVADAAGVLSAVASHAGAKAARLAVARAAGFPVLPGWVLPAAESRPAVRAAAAAVRDGRRAAARRAALSCAPDRALAGELRAAVCALGGRVIVRSSSPLEADPRWAGAFSSMAEVGPDDVLTAVRSCWAAAFAADPLARLDACGLPPDALELALLIQPELNPEAGGTARVGLAAPGGSGTAWRRPAPDGPPGGWPTADGAAEARPHPVEVIVDGVRGHPGPLLAGWAEGASARVRLAGPGAPGWPEPGTGGPLTGLLGADLVRMVARLAAGVYWALGDTGIEWAAGNGTVWLLQTAKAGPSPVLPPEPAGHATTLDGRSTAPDGRDAAPDGGAAVPDGGAAVPDGGAAVLDGPLPCRYAARELMPLLAAAVQAAGRRVAARPAAAGQAAGRLVPCRPHQRPAPGCRDAILLIDQPVPALAPLLFAARGVIARGGTASAHLAEVARSLAVPMVTGCRPELVTGPAPARDGWLAAIDGSTGEVALLPA